MQTLGFYSRRVRSQFPKSRERSSFTRVGRGIFRLYSALMVWLYLCLTFRSLPQVHKYLGWGGVAVYLVITAAALRLLKRLGTARRIAERITDRQARWL